MKRLHAGCEVRALDPIHPHATDSLHPGDQFILEDAEQHNTEQKPVN